MTQIEQLLAEIENGERELDTVAHLPYFVWKDRDRALMAKLDVVEALIEEIDQ
jgi:hypothetical protein